MISYENIQVANTWTEGFEVTLTEPLSLAFGPGKFFFQPASGDPVVWDFPAVSFDAEADPDIPVGYDVYLLDGTNEDGEQIEVVRTELGLNVLQLYEGETPLLHALFSFVMQPGETTLKDIDINVRTMQQTDAGKAGDGNEEDPAKK